MSEAPSIFSTMPTEILWFHGPMRGIQMVNRHAKAKYETCETLQGIQLLLFFVFVHLFHFTFCLLMR